MIPSKHIKPGDRVDLYDAEDDRVVELPTIDAMHALTVEPERYFLERPVDEPVEEVKPEPTIDAPRSTAKRFEEEDDGA